MKTLATLCCALFVFSVNAQPVTVMGAQSCGKWVAERGNLVQYSRNFGWLTGFLSGMSAATRVDAMGPVDGDSIALWVDNYCRANPLARMDTAATVLFDELRPRK